VVVASVTLLVAAGPASALTLRAGDILVANPNAPDVGDVIRVDPVTGQQTTLSDDSSPGTDHFAGAYDLVLDRFGRLFVIDFKREGGGDGQLIQVDPATGEQSVLSTGGFFTTPFGLALAPNGKLLVSDDDAFGDDTGGLFEIDPVTGVQRVVASNATSALDLFMGPYDVAVNRRGRILVADYQSGDGGDGAIIGVDGATGQQSLVSDNAISPANRFSSVQGVIFDRGEINAIVVDDTVPELLGVDGVSGAQSLISGPGSPGPDLLQSAHRAVFDLDGSLLVADYAADMAAGAIFRVDRATGAQSLVADSSTSDQDLFKDPTAAIVVPPRCAGQYATIYGTPGRDTLTGSRFPDVIAGLAGNDAIRGLGANDRLCGGAGRDRLLGGKGRDRLLGGNGPDRLIGGRGRDRLRGGPGRDLQRQ
jgi:Ca2+-binding RTX toxin-like protein